MPRFRIGQSVLPCSTILKLRRLLTLTLHAPDSGGTIQGTWHFRGTKRRTSRNCRGARHDASQCTVPAHLSFPFLSISILWQAITSYMGTKSRELLLDASAHPAPNSAPGTPQRVAPIRLGDERGALAAAEAQVRRLQLECAALRERSSQLEDLCAEMVKVSSNIPPTKAFCSTTAVKISASACVCVCVCVFCMKMSLNTGTIRADCATVTHWQNPGEFLPAGGRALPLWNWKHTLGRREFGTRLQCVGGDWSVRGGGSGTAMHKRGDGGGG
jgi:hypothetical protein